VYPFHGLVDRWTFLPCRQHKVAVNHQPQVLRVIKQLFWYFVVTLVIDDANIDVKRVITGSLSVNKMDGW
jgi:hypothetical protein